MQPYGQIRQLIDRVRARWRALVALQALVRGALIAALIVGVALVASRWTAGAPVLLMTLVGGAALLAAGAVVWCLAPLRRGPPGKQGGRHVGGRGPALGARPGAARGVARA